MLERQHLATPFGFTPDGVPERQGFHLPGIFHIPMRVRPLDRVPQDDDYFHIRVVFQNTPGSIVNIHIFGRRLAYQSMPRLMIEEGVVLGIIRGLVTEICFIVKEMHFLFSATQISGCSLK